MMHAKVFFLMTIFLNFLTINNSVATEIFMKSVNMADQTHVAAKRCIDGSYVFYNNTFQFDLETIKHLQSYQDALAAGAKPTATYCDFKTFGVPLPGSGRGVMQLDTKDMYPRYENTISSDSGSSQEVLRLGNAFTIDFRNHTAHDSKVIEQLHKCLLLIQSGKVSSFNFSRQVIGNTDDGLFRYILHCEIN